MSDLSETMKVFFNFNIVILNYKYDWIKRIKFIIIAFDIVAEWVWGMLLDVVYSVWYAWI